MTYEDIEETEEAVEYPKDIFIKDDQVKAAKALNLTIHRYRPGWKRVVVIDDLEEKDLMSRVSVLNAYLEVKPPRTPTQRNLTPVLCTGCRKWHIKSNAIIGPSGHGRWCKDCL